MQKHEIIQDEFNSLIKQLTLQNQKKRTLKNLKKIMNSKKDALLDILSLSSNFSIIENSKKNFNVKLKKSKPANSPIIINDFLAIYSLKPFISKRIFKPHKYYNGNKYYILYTFEEGLIFCEDGLVISGANLWFDFCALFDNINEGFEDFFGINYV